MISVSRYFKQFSLCHTIRLTWVGAEDEGVGGGILRLGHPCRLHKDKDKTAVLYKRATCFRGDVKIHKVPLAAAKVLQHSLAIYSFSYIDWLQLAAEYGGCSL